MAERLKGKPVADAMKEDLVKRVEDLKAKGVTPKIGIIRVGANPDDLFYEGGIKKTSDGIGLAYEIFEHPEDVNQEEFEQSVLSVGADSSIHGILMFAPLPKHLDEKKIRSLIPVEKDVDCMTLGSAGKVFTDDQTGFPPCTPTACMEMLKFYEIPLKGKKVTVVGRSLIVGKPVAMLLLREHATVTICHSRTENLDQVCADADILVAAVGRAKMIGSSYVKPGQIVIDVGINPDPDNPGKYCGDVDFAAVEPIVDKITPVPGGVGSVTTIVLCKHTVMACEMQQGR
ncbi:MAG TPA: bifunctional 5,10-methylenetetrahydrofolate dehydrogenase/5,10-methenyltetrahydrofolate cyclohydrolase [Bacillota bacterium]|jgi:methylenetetrahydrofolate dehydrogenase (NADP+)/methenyltetrahydrofolate cyclohydrolase|nr:bifunctional 5,10-methylenetetrahydrofolate dehydrogenase/5,10-methenyltetrahydrofolate cyclohydrolase [Bacillota bacterium]HOB28353.1 bifunctional 5,10-methylenetetrahydrofolate dehydrogenase/5,10-methenyltetrahydrofolate cyclohydrolase [Bacillota bacterium]HPZ41269.1 bifunctional 5,10-methylenetetrahydrofolate dehydrogenase/5,10-methenyltetrahydrofolate cyclohydrolase [Bacillota bacterium]HQD51902.1 bifunctional 5,10-methylenetetrahydrofolate dehydrogenase/5,10-methenyltetrahydrofolate cycl